MPRHLQHPQYLHLSTTSTSPPPHPLHFNTISTTSHQSSSLTSTHHPSSHAKGSSVLLTCSPGQVLPSQHNLPYWPCPSSVELFTPCCRCWQVLVHLALASQGLGFFLGILKVSPCTLIGLLAITLTQPSQPS